MANSQPTTTIKVTADVEEVAKALDDAKALVDEKDKRIAELEDQLALIEANANPAEPEVVYAPPPARVVGEGWPVGVFIGFGADATHIDGSDWKVDPKTGCITGPAKSK